MTTGTWKSVRVSPGWETDIDELFNRLIDEPWGRVSRLGWRPEVDVYETPDEYILAADLPGVRAENVALEVSEHRVTLRGTRSLQKVVETAVSINIERRSGRFSRSFHLEHAVNPETVALYFDSGLCIARVKKTHSGAGAPVAEN